MAADQRRPDLLLLGCVKTKAAAAQPARTLYISPLWRARRAYAEASGVPWFLLSALYGLVPPDEVIEPYDRTLVRAGSAYRKAWASRVVERLCARFGALAGNLIEIHAGQAYVEPLAPDLEESGARVSLPLAGLTLGQQLSWYRHHDPAAGSVARRG